MTSTEIRIPQLNWKNKWTALQTQFQATLTDFQTRYVRAKLSADTATATGTSTDSSDESQTFLEESKSQLTACMRDMKDLTQTISDAIDGLRKSTHTMMADVHVHTGKAATLERGQTQRTAKERGSAVMLDEFTFIYNEYYWSCLRMVALMGVMGVAVAKGR